MLTNHPSTDEEDAFHNNATRQLSESSGEAICRLQFRYRLSEEECFEMIQDVLNTFGTSAENEFPAVQKVESKHRQAWHLLVAYQAGQKPKQVRSTNGVLTRSDMAVQIKAAYDVAAMSTRAMALELGYYTAAGTDNVAELAKLTGLGKQTVNKCAMTFQRKLGFPPRPGQRTAAARRHMTEAVEKRLRKKP